MALNKEDNLSDLESFEDIESTQNDLLISEIIDLSQYCYENEQEISNTNNDSILTESGNLDYSPEDL
ncbi:271_t:CDS:1, partial [Cetraspora pellucida]